MPDALALKGIYFGAEFAWTIAQAIQTIRHILACISRKRRAPMNSSGTRRILLVDDEDAILLAFSKVLSGPTVEIDSASTLEDAKRLLGERVYAAVIADLRMSGAAIMDGFVVISEAKKRNPATKIIVITAYGGNHTKDKVFSLGADMYLEKPVSPGNVKEILESMGVYRPDSPENRSAESTDEQRRSE
ncbi:MAG: response regulator [Chitinivibrionales bacterium]|nr:response regulator [Chitinivibrionales bacterium]MBD3396767.1 response regulator [Chitinivibrionales bacterium]